VFYLGYGAGVVFFAVRPGQAAPSARRSAGLGALLGAFAYGTYDLTNLATLKGFTLSVALVDMAWGVTITAISSLAAHGAAQIADGRKRAS